MDNQDAHTGPMAAMTEERFRELLEAKAKAVEAARVSLHERVRELVEEYGRGSKAGREDYVTLIPSDRFHRLTVAFEEYERQRQRKITTEAVPNG